MPAARKLNVFISYATPDVDSVSALYKRLSAESWLAPWFDRESLLPGMDWKLEIDKALRAAALIIICLSTKSVTREGYVQKEMKLALDFAEEKPEGVIFVIPLRLDDCEVPQRLGKWQWVDDFAPESHARLLKSLQLRAEGLGIAANAPKSPVAAPANEDLDLCQFIKINSPAVPEPFWIGKYPVTNAQYERFLKSDDFANPDFWTKFPKYDENCQLIGDWGDDGLNWLKVRLKDDETSQLIGDWGDDDLNWLKDYEYFPSEMQKVEPAYWQGEYFGIAQPRNPVVGVTWYEANAYCKWLATHWRELPEMRVISNSQPKILRLPLETEWVAAAGGDHPEERYPWDFSGKVTADEQEIIKRANVANRIGCTTPVNQYLAGKSPFGVMDMAGNAWEWQANLFDERPSPAWRGGSWNSELYNVHVSVRSWIYPYYWYDGLGFRVVLVSHL